MAHKLFSTKKKLTSPSTYLIEKAVCFPGYIVWFYFDSGHHQTWNLYHQRLLHKGKIEADPTLKFFYFSSNPPQVVYHSKQNKEIRVLNIYTNKFSPAYRHCSLPTLAALPESDKSNEEKIENLESFTELEVLPDSGTIVVMEPKPMNQTFNEHVITAFCGAENGKNDSGKGFENQLIHNSNNKQMFIVAYNRKDTVILYSQCFMNQPIEFVLWNCKLKQTGSKVYKFNSSIECVLIDARPWKKDQVAFFVNPNNSAKPRMIVYDIAEEKDIASLELTTQDSMISEVLVVNGDQDVVLFENFAENVEICLFNPRLNCITAKQIVEEDPQIVISQDKKYIVEIEDDYDGEDGPSRKMAISCKISLISELKFWVLHMLKCTGYSKIYGQGVIQDIVHMVTGDCQAKQL